MQSYGKRVFYFGLLFVNFVAMRILLILIFFAANFTKISAQTDALVATEICTAYKTIKAKDDLSLYEKQGVVKAKILKTSIENIPAETLLKQKNLLNFINVFDYKVKRNLQKNCDIKQLNAPYQFMPLTLVVDVDGVFDTEQFKTLKTKIEKIHQEKELDILLLEVDDFYPFDDITAYSFEILNNWNNGFIDQPKKGKMIIVFSKELREIRISTDAISKHFLGNEFIQSTIDDFIFPNFKKGEYFTGISETLDKISEKL